MKRVHRTLHFGRPLGEDVAAFLDGVHDELKHRKLGFLFRGKTVEARRHSIARAAFALGLSEKVHTAALAGHVGKLTQRKIRNPILRSPLDRRRERKRKPVLRRWRVDHRGSQIAVMFDSITLSEIPTDAPAVAGYTGGNWPTFQQLRELFPHARLLSIAVSSREDAECLDVEPGDAEISDAPAWCKRQFARGLGVVYVYCSVSQVQALRSALHAAGIDLKRVRIWSAHYGAGEHICGPDTCGYPGLTAAVDGTQWTSEARGRNLDQSKLTPDFFGH